MHLASRTDYWYTFSSFRQVQVPYTKSPFQRFRVVHSAVSGTNTFSFNSLLLPSRMSRNALSLPPSILVLACLFFLSFLLLPSCTPPYLSTDSTYLFLISSNFLAYFLGYAIPPYSSSPFRYFLPYNDTSYMASNLLLGVLLCLHCHFNFLTSLFVSSGCIPGSVHNTVLLIVLEHASTFLAVVICAFPAVLRTSPFPFPYFSCIL